MEAYNSGVNYFDTAYIYPGSEAAIGEIFERNNIRDKINIATKLPHYMLKNPEMREALQELYEFVESRNHDNDMEDNIFEARKLVDTNTFDEE